MSETSMELRALVSARSSGDAYDLRADIREKLIGFLQRELPGALQRGRLETVATSGAESGLPAVGRNGPAMARSGGQKTAVSRQG